MIRDLVLWGAVAGYSATIVNQSLWRSQEGRMLESSAVVSRLVQIDACRLASITSAFSTSRLLRRSPTFKN